MVPAAAAVAASITTTASPLRVGLELPPALWSVSGRANAASAARLGPVFVRSFVRPSVDSAGAIIPVCGSLLLVGSRMVGGRKGKRETLITHRIPTTTERKSRSFNTNTCVLRLDARIEYGQF